MVPWGMDAASWQTLSSQARNAVLLLCKKAGDRVTPTCPGSATLTAGVKALRDEEMCGLLSLTSSTLPRNNR